MDSNFDFLKEEKNFYPVYKASKIAENNYKIDPAACCLLCRSAAEYAFIWLYEKIPAFKDLYEKNPELKDGMGSPSKSIKLYDYIICSDFGEETKNKLHSLKQKGNDAAHHLNNGLDNKSAQEALEELHYFMQAVYYHKLNGLNPIKKFDLALIAPETKKTSSTKTKEKPASNRIDILLTTEMYSNSLSILPMKIKDKVETKVHYMTKQKKPEGNCALISNAKSDGIYEMPVDNQFKYSMIFSLQDNVCILLFVGLRDLALQQGRGIKYEINAETNCIQVYESANPMRREIKPEEDKCSAASHDIAERSAYVFAKWDADDLLYLGVPKEYLTKLIDVKTLKEFAAIQKALPREAVDALYCILNGDSVEKAFKVNHPQNIKVKREDIKKAAQNQSVGIAPIENEEDVKHMFEAPLEKWRVYLHPQQRHIAYRSYAGSVRVLGSAGTGKTVVALHHAKYLAKTLGEDKKILFTTYTKSLMNDINTRLNAICSVDERNKIEVLHFDGILQKILSESTAKQKVIIYDDHILEEKWREAVEQAAILDKTSYNWSFYQDEWVNVVNAQGIKSDEYINEDRAGRGRRLDRDSRQKICPVFRKYAELMRNADKIDREAAANYCVTLLKDELTSYRFDSVIIDESPNFGPAQFRLLRALAGDPHPDDMFITGDSRQRIYSGRPKVVLSKCGINIRGRSYSLAVNYRTTGRILEVANLLLKDIIYDDLDGGNDNSGDTYSTIEGEWPVYNKYETKEAEVQGVVSAIQKQIKSGIKPSEIAIVARTHKVLDKLQSELFRAGIPVSKETEKNCIHLLTMHKSQGMEYSYVYVVAVNKDVIPLRVALDKAYDKAERTNRLNEEKQLLYVAITRARNEVFISYTGKPSEFIKPFITPAKQEDKRH